MVVTAIRIYVEEQLEAGLDISCTQAQSNYLLNVMRLSNGSEIHVFDGQSGEWCAQVTRKGRGACVLHVSEQTRPQEDGPDVHYLFAPVKRARLDFMVQKATELGVAAMRPVYTRRTIAKRIKFERMRANVIEAAEQCGVLRIPQIYELVALDKLLDTWDPARRIIYCDEGTNIGSPIEALVPLEPGPLAVLVGPEGGFDDGERWHLQSLSYVTPISLGPRVMRSDTAAVAALALVNAVLGDWR